MKVAISIILILANSSFVYAAFQYSNPLGFSVMTLVILAAINDLPGKINAKL